MNFKIYVLCVYCEVGTKLLCFIQVGCRGMKALSVFNFSLHSNIDSALTVNLKLYSVRQVVISEKGPHVTMYQYGACFIY
jgi:hypothetical protein